MTTETDRAEALEWAHAATEGDMEIADCMALRDMERDGEFEDSGREIVAVAYLAGLRAERERGHAELHETRTCLETSRRDLEELATRTVDAVEMHLADETRIRALKRRLIAADALISGWAKCDSLCATQRLTPGGCNCGRENAIRAYREAGGEK